MNRTVYRVIAAFGFVAFCGLGSCGPEDAPKNVKKSDPLPAARDVLVLHWKFNYATAQGYVFKKVADGKDAVEIARVGRGEAVLSQTEGTLSYSLPERASRLLSTGDCIAVSALLSSGVESAPSSRACLSTRP